MIQQIKIEEFLALAKENVVLDVRSPGEYAHAHIPGALSLPLFSDEERKVVGTAYKQQSREDAIKLGLDFYGGKMRGMVEEVERIIEELNPVTNGYLRRKDHKVLVHCWRGGMRSAGVAWLLDLYGFKVYTLVGGYKSFRNWALAQFDRPYSFNILGGYTGSGKTEILKELNWEGHTIIDLEDIAQHKGSAFGGYDLVQPSQEMFENILAVELSKANVETKDGASIWIEDESQRIGSVNLPNGLWQTMRNSPLYFINIPFEERLNFIVSAYGKYKKEELVNSIIRIQKRLGGQNTKTAINCLLENDHKECFRVLLNYYDKYYDKSMVTRENAEALLHRIDAETVDAAANCKRLTA